MTGVRIRARDDDADDDDADPTGATGLADGRFRLPPARVAALRARLGAPPGPAGDAALLRSLLEAARSRARPPVSAYRVGAAALGASGAVWMGCNLELAGAPLSASVHAEQFVASSAAAGGETALSVVAVTAAPCGHCRQFFCEVNDAAGARFVFPSPSGDGGWVDASLDALLPHRFGPEDLLPEGAGEGAAPTPRVLAPAPWGLRLSARGRAALDAACRAAGPGALADGLRAAAAEALAAAERSHAPYSRCPSGLALVGGAGEVAGAGAYLESAAFNPSLPPLQAALVGAVTRAASRGRSAAETPWSDVVGGVLCERGGGR